MIKLEAKKTSEGNELMKLEESSILEYTTMTMAINPL
jgi:hypothetical protein